MSKRFLLAAICVACCTSTVCLAQVLSVSELSSRDLQELNRDRTIVMIPGGIFEQHGPYLPTFTDGYLNEWVGPLTCDARPRDGSPVPAVGQGSVQHQHVP